MDPAFLDRLALSYGLYAVPAESGKNFSPDCMRSTAAPWRGNTAKRTEKHGIVGQYLV